MNITNSDPVRDNKHDYEHSDHEHSDEDYSYEDWGGMYKHMHCPYMEQYNCPFMYGMMPYKQMGRDAYEPDDDYDDDYDDAQEAISPMNRPRCRWPYRPCWYGGRWHCCRRRRPRPRPWWMY